MKNDVKKILVIRYRFIGDTLLTVPFLRNLRYAYPDAQIDMLVAPVSGDIIKECPYVDNFIYFDTTRKHRYENDGGEKKTFWSYVKLLREEKYDKAYVLKRSLSSAFLAFAAGIKERVGFDTEGRGIFLTKRVPYENNRHEVECFLDVLRADDIEVKDDYLENWIKNEEYQKINEIFKKNNIENKKKVLVHATSGNRKKEWTKENFAKIIEYLTNEKHVQVIFSGTKNDSLTYEKIGEFITCGLERKPLNLCGELTLRESLALTEKCDLIVGCDSGNLHIAASVGIPVIGIYGPMNPDKWHPWCEKAQIITADLPCRPCSLKKKCKFDYDCIKKISPDMVKKAIDDVL